MTLHFKNKEAYRKYLAYKHMHGIEEGTNQKVTLHGHPHKVHHERGKRKNLL